MVVVTFLFELVLKCQDSPEGGSTVTLQVTQISSVVSTLKLDGVHAQSPGKTRSLVVFLVGAVKLMEYRQDHGRV